MVASPSSFTIHHSLLKAAAAAAAAPPPAQHSAPSSPSLSSTTTTASSSSRCSTLSDYSQESSAGSSCSSPPNSSTLAPAFEQQQQQPIKPAGRTGSLLHTSRRQARPQNIEVPSAAAFLPAHFAQRNTAAPPSNTVLAALPVELSASSLRDAAATAADEALEREIQRATRRMPTAACDAPSTGKAHTSTSSSGKLDDWRRSSSAGGWHEPRILGAGTFVDEEVLEVLDTPAIAHDDDDPLLTQHHGGSNDDFARLTRSNSTGVLSSTTPSASRIARGARVPTNLKLDTSNHVTVISSSPAPDDLPGAKARRILGIDAGTGGGWDKSPTRAESGYESSGGGGSRAALASMLNLSALKKSRSARRRSQSSQLPFAATTAPSEASLSAPSGASASRFFRRSSQMPLAVPSHSGSDSRASFESQPSPLPLSSSGHSPAPSYSFPASPCSTSSPASMSTDVIATPVSGTRSTFAFGLKDRSSPHSKVSTAPSALPMSQVSPDDDELWQRQLQLIERNAVWQTSIEHRPRPRMPAPASAAPLRLAQESRSSDEAMYAHNRASLGRTLSTSSASGTAGLRTAQRNSRRPSFDPHPLRSPGTPLSRSASMDRLPRGIFEAPREAPRRPSVGGGAESDGHSSGVEYIDFTAAGASAPVSRRPSIDDSSLHMPALTHSGCSTSSGTVDSLASRHQRSVSPPPHAARKEVYAALPLPPVPQHEGEDDRPFISFDMERSDSEGSSSASLRSAAKACLRRRGRRAHALSLSSNGSSECLPSEAHGGDADEEAEKEPESDEENEAGVILLALANEAPQLHFRAERRSRARLSFPSSAVSASDHSERDDASLLGSPLFARLGLEPPSPRHGLAQLQVCADGAKLDGLGFDDEQSWLQQVTPTRPTAVEGL